MASHCFPLLWLSEVYTVIQGHFLSSTKLDPHSQSHSGQRYASAWIIKTIIPRVAADWKV